MYTEQLDRCTTARKCISLSTKLLVVLLVFVLLNHLTAIRLSVLCLCDFAVAAK